MAYVGVLRVLFLLLLVLVFCIMLRLISIKVEKEAYLEVLEGEDFLAEFPERFVLKDFCKLGRGEDNHIVILDPYASKHHAKIIRENGDFFIIDNNSRNGVLVNGKKINDKKKLKKGDKIKIGKVVLLFT